MTEYFYVLGLPRSRSLWLSHVLNDEISKCYHEKLTIHGSEVLSESGYYRYIGSVDTNPLNKFKYNGPLAIVKRNPADVKQSIVNWFKADQFSAENWPLAVSEYIDRYTKELNKINTFTIAYEDLDETEKLIELIQYLKPEAKIDRTRLIRMQDTIIKVRNRDLTNALDHTKQFSGLSLSPLELK